MWVARTSRNRRWYVFYGVCLASVLSFLLFEALDIDGSGLRLPATAATTALSLSLGEDRGDEIHVHATAALLRGIVLHEAATGTEHITDPPHLAVALSLQYHVALPRASLDSPPLA
jgi:hypothetical protein